MKKVLLAFLAFGLCSGAFSQGVIPNGDFTSWTAAGTGYDSPPSWKTSNDTINDLDPLHPGNVRKNVSNPSYYNTPPSINLHSRQYTILTTTIKIPAIAVTGNAVIKVYPSYSISGGYPFVDRPDTVKYSMGYIAGLGTDTASMSVLLSKWNGTARDTIAWFIKKVNASTAFAIHYDTLRYYRAGNPDTCMITLLSSTSFPAIDTTSELYFDNFSFMGIDSTHYTTPGAGITEREASAVEVKVFPNPASREVSFSLMGSSGGMLTISNILGQKMIETRMDRATIKVDVGKLENGLYIYRFVSSGDSETKTGRFVVSK